MYIMYTCYVCLVMYVYDLHFLDLGIYIFYCFLWFFHIDFKLALCTSFDAPVACNDLCSFFIWRLLYRIKSIQFHRGSPLHSPKSHNQSFDSNSNFLPQAWTASILTIHPFSILIVIAIENMRALCKCIRKGSQKGKYPITHKT